jgi:hypothetical protein
MLLPFAEKIRFAQIKEKFGGLNMHITLDKYDDLLNSTTNIAIIFYINMITIIYGKQLKKQSTEEWKEARKILMDAEHKSRKLCELCGNEGEKSYSKYWVKTVCLKCVGEYEELTYEQKT